MKIKNAPGRKNERRIRAYDRLTEKISSLLEDGEHVRDVTGERREILEWLFIERKKIEKKIIPTEVALSTKRKIFRGAR